MSVTAVVAFTMAIAFASCLVRDCGGHDQRTGAAEIGLSASLYSVIVFGSVVVLLMLLVRRSRVVDLTVAVTCIGVGVLIVALPPIAAVTRVIALIMLAAVGAGALASRGTGG